ncbi:hypothetical protein [Larkinella soli]|uniref:hypothetical protein n=1 Tax=Larkinella soli TaxID=1770527 RepID=UPI0013E2A641|nr:hypothetical protein [Larkinella soli]
MVAMFFWRMQYEQVRETISTTKGMIQTVTSPGSDPGVTTTFSNSLASGMHRLSQKTRND